MIKQETKYIIFDLGGVLVNLDRDRCVKNFKELGFANIEEMISSYHQDGIFLQLEQGLITAEEFRQKVRHEITRPATDEQIDAAWNSLLADTPTYRLDLLLELRKKYTLYLLSNTNEIHWQWCLENVFAYKGHTIDNFFEATFLSFRLHKTKPSPGIFQAVINESTLIPEETFFIDDSTANCETAEILGITTYTPAPGENWSHLFK
ncbi:HAD family phosphatase [Bacteroides sp. OttesenSCG-928-J23]|nr:HAD family phosphatase [Bacteroides sp. OttesenSCG-928-J23]